MKLSEITNIISSLPTIMDISDELLIINGLMSLDVCEIVESMDAFCSILKKVVLSHQDSGFMELTKDNEEDFIRFYHWLKKIKDEWNLELNDNFIDTFNLTFAEIKQLMS